MWKNYLIIALRNLYKKKLFSAINLLGLALGMAACLSIFYYAHYELSYNSQFPDPDQTYRLSLLRAQEGETDLLQRTPSPLKPAIAGLDGVDGAFRMLQVDYQNNSLMVEGWGTTQSIQPQGVYYADPEMEDLLALPLVAGSLSGLDESLKLVLTESTAEALFGDQWQVGATVRLSNNVVTADFELVGVLADLPGNTTFDFTVLLSMPSINLVEGYASTESWDTWQSELYLTSSQSPEELRSEIARSILQKEAAFQQPGQTWEIRLLPLSQDRLSYYTDAGTLNTTARKVLFGLAGLGILILVLAWTNFINLSTVRAMERSREVGVRKVMGSSQLQLRVQFMAEAILMNGMAALLALTTLQLGMPWFRQVTGLSTLVPPTQGQFWAFGIGFLLLGSLISGAYPAFVLSGYRPIEVLKGKIAASGSGNLLRKGLVVFQFVASICMITGALAIYRQLHFMQTTELGLTLENIVVMDAPPRKMANNPAAESEAINSFLDELQQQAGVAAVTTSSFVPGGGIGWNTQVRTLQMEPDKALNVGLIACDHRFARAYGLELVSGQFYGPTDDTFGVGDFVINEAAALALGFASAEEALGQTLTGSPMFPDLTIQGVVKNFHHQSLQHRIVPTGFVMSAWSNYYSAALVLPQGQDSDAGLATLQTQVAQIEMLWDRFFPDTPFGYTFLDDRFAAQYRAEQELSTIISFFTFISIALALLGLLGLSSYTVMQRTKEIGIRKVLGASSIRVLATLAAPYLRIVSLAALLSLPLSYWAIQQWLNTFPYRASLTWWLFTVPVLVILLCAVCIVGALVVRVARQNPITSLRYE